jgi:hypothetical protein
VIIMTVYESSGSGESYKAELPNTAYQPGSMALTGYATKSRSGTHLSGGMGLDTSYFAKVSVFNPQYNGQKFHYQDGLVPAPRYESTISDQTRLDRAKQREREMSSMSISASVAEALKYLKVDAKTIQLAEQELKKNS